MGRWLFRVRAPVMPGTGTLVLRGGLLAVLLAGALGVGYGVPWVAPERAVPVRVMTYNIRFASSTPPHTWAERLPMVLGRVRKHRPGLLGVQEAFWPQMRDLSTALREYDWVGLGRKGGARDEFEAIFYRRDRFEALDFNHFWLSNTPSVVGSKSWGSGYVRMVTWVKFRDRRTKAVFYMVNTHFDNVSEYSRVRSAQLLLQHIRDFEPGLPVIVTGDFNAEAGRSRTYDILTAPHTLTDTWTAAARHGPALNTLGSWTTPVPGGPRIDWILSQGPVRTLTTWIDPYQHKGHYPSDHYPVIADLQLPRP